MLIIVQNVTTYCTVTGISESLRFEMTTESFSGALQVIGVENSLLIAGLARPFSCLAPTVHRLLLH